MSHACQGVARWFKVRRMVQSIRQAIGWLETQHTFLRQRRRERLGHVRTQTQTLPPRLRFEALEPRVLLSADLTGGAAAGQLTGTLQPGDSPAIVLTVNNASDTAVSNPVRIDWLASTDGTLSADDTRLGSALIDASALGANASIQVSVPLNLSALGAPGSYTLLGSIDPLNEIPESNEANNTIVVPGTLNLAKAVGLASNDAGKTVNVLAYSWKSHALLDGVSVSNGSLAGNTDANGIAMFVPVTDNNLSLTATRPIPTAETTQTNAAVNLQDAIAILKMVVGLDVNGGGVPLSPYQSLAADFDGNGRVELTDAIGVLKHVVGLSSPNPAWRFTNEADTSVPGLASLTPGTTPPINIDLSHTLSLIHI